MFAVSYEKLNCGTEIACCNSVGVSEEMDTTAAGLVRREARMALEKELETYQKKLPELQGDEGKFALVHGDDMSVFETYEDAINAGYQRYRLEPFLVKKIQAVEQVQFVTRALGLPCHT